MGEDNEAYAFGNYLLQGMIDSTKLRNRGMKLTSDLYVLKNSDMPAALLEMGFVSNAENAALLSEHPEAFAQGIYNGVVGYFESAYAVDINILICIIGISVMFVIVLTIIFFITKKRYNKILNSINCH